MTQGFTAAIKPQPLIPTFLYRRRRGGAPDPDDPIYNNDGADENSASFLKGIWYSDEDINGNILTISGYGASWGLYSSDGQVVDYGNITSSDSESLFNLNSDAGGTSYTLFTFDMGIITLTVADGIAASFYLEGTF